MFFFGQIYNRERQNDTHPQELTTDTKKRMNYVNIETYRILNIQIKISFA